MKPPILIFDYDSFDFHSTGWGTVDQGPIELRTEATEPELRHVVRLRMCAADGQHGQGRHLRLRHGW